VQDLEKPEYFPYRWGHAFWAYVGGKWGDRWVASLLRSSANPRGDLTGFALQLGTTPDALNAGWHQAMQEATAALERDRPSLTSAAKRVISEGAGGGRLNVGPKLSTDGRAMVFFSEKDLFSVDLYLADPVTGHVERRLTKTANDPHFDSLEFLNSAGAWSPGGRSLAFTALRAGEPILGLLDVALGRVIREIPLTGLDDALGPAWSPDSTSIVFSGNRGGLVDLYRLTLATGAIEPLTHDAYSEFEPAFSPDGKWIVFSTDRFSTDLANLIPGPLQLARMDVSSKEVTPIAGFRRGKHLSPQISPDGKTITFVAEPDGVANLYRMSIDGGPISQLTSLATGVAGITATSPALSMASSTGRLAFSVFEKGGASVYTLDAPDEVSLVPPVESDRGALIPPRVVDDGPVQQILTDYRRGLPSAAAKTTTSPYGRKLELDAIGQPTVSAGVSSFGAYVGGSVSALFKDALGDRLLSTGAQISGTLEDLGGWLTYFNRRHRWNWGVSAEQSPYRAEFVNAFTDSDAKTFVAQSTIERQLSRGVFGLAEYPLNQSTRFEFSAGARHLSFSQEQRTSTFDLASGNLIQRTQETIPIGRPLSLAEATVALVHDTSFFGAVSPIFGQRYRVELGRSQGTLIYNSVLVDARQYLMPVRPFTIAIRGMSFGRYGRDADDQLLVPLFLGYPEMVRGYGFGSFSATECPDAKTAAGAAQLCTSLDNLVGSRLAVANIEVRAPIPGLFHHEIEYGRVPLEVVGFFDAGVAWSNGTRPAFAGGTRPLARSAGAAVRVNVFGLFVVELSAARPLDRLTSSLRWQFGIRQGF
jgi:Tol biopolymer transport system component